MVQFTTVALGAMMALASPALAGRTSFQVNYYYDGGCSQYASSPPNVPRQSNYNWAWNWSNSANIASCVGYSICHCTFYTESNGEGEIRWVDFFSSNQRCASYWGKGFKSFNCVYF